MEFKELIVDTFNLGSLPQAQQDSLVAKLQPALLNRLAARMAEELSDDELTVFNKMLEESPEDALEVIDDRFPEFTKLVEEELLEMKQDFNLEAN